MATLERTIDAAKHSALDTTTRGHYTQQGDKYVLNVDDAEHLKAAVEEERLARKKLEEIVKAYGEVTPEQVKELSEAKSKAEREKDFAAGRLDKILQETEAKHAKTLDLRDKTEQQLRASLQAALIAEEAVRAIVAHGGNPDLLMPIIERNAKLEQSGDRHVAVIVGEKGGPLLKAGAQKADDYMPISEYVGTVLKSDKRYAGAFAANVGSGSGGHRTGPVLMSERPTEAKQQTIDRLAQQVAAGATRVK